MHFPFQTAVSPVIRRGCIGYDRELMKPKTIWSDPGAPGHVNPVRYRLWERAADWFSLQRG